MLVAFGNRTDPNQVEIRGVKTKDQKGNVTEMPPPVIQMMQSTYRGAVSMPIISWQGLPQESATVPRAASTVASRRAPTRSGARGAASPIRGRTRPYRCPARCARRASTSRSSWSWPRSA